MRSWSSSLRYTALPLSCGGKRNCRLWEVLQILCGVKSQLRHLLTVWPWASYLLFLCLQLFIIKAEISCRVLVNIKYFNKCKFIRREGSIWQTPCKYYPHINSFLPYFCRGPLGDLGPWLCLKATSWTDERREELHAEGTQPVFPLFFWAACP